MGLWWLEHVTTGTLEFLCAPLSQCENANGLEKNHKVPLRQRCKRCLRLHSLKTLKHSNWKNLSGMTGRPCKRTQRLWLRKEDPPGKLSLRLTPRPWSTSESHAHTYLQQDHRFNFLQTRHQLTFIHSQNSDFPLDARRAMGFISPSRLLSCQIKWICRSQ